MAPPLTLASVYNNEAGVWTRKERPSLPATGTQPTGAGITRYQDLFHSGDTLSGAINRLSSAQQVSFPIDLFQMNDFSDSGKYGCLIPSHCHGILGCGIGETVFQIAPGTSTAITRGLVPTTGTNPLYVFRTGTNVPFVGSDFTINGTDQQTDPNISRPHCYGGLMMDHITSTAPVLTRIKTIGIPGSSNSPPGETFAINDYGCNGGIYTDLEGDGRRASDGARVGASPFGCNNSSNVTLIDCYFHHSLTSMPTFWETDTATTYNLRSEYNGSGSGSLRGHGVNHERVSGVFHHYNLNVIVNHPGGNTGMWMSFFSDQVNDTTVYLHNPTWDADASGSFHNCFCIQMNTGTYMGNPSKQLTPPTLYKADGTAFTALDGNSLPGSFTPASQFIWFH